MHSRGSAHTGAPRKSGGNVKKNILNLLATAVALYMFTNAACAQSNMHLRATVPFQFVANGKVLPSGVYDVKELEPSIIVIQNRMDGSSIYARTDTGRPAKGTPGLSTLVFHRYGNAYFLAQITLSDNNEARQLPVSREEQKLGKAKTKPELVLVSLLREPVKSNGK
jgi:hypothetical protein